MEIKQTNALAFPAHCTALDEAEMTYIDGGVSLGGLGGLILSTFALYAASQFVPKLVVYTYTKVRDFFLGYKPMPLE